MNVIIGGTQLLLKIQRLISDNPRIIRKQVVQTTYQIFLRLQSQFQLAQRLRSFKWRKMTYIFREREEMFRMVHASYLLIAPS